MISVDELKAGMEVIAGDQTIGDLYGILQEGSVTYLHVRRFGAGMDDLYIPSIAVEKVAPKHIYLTIAAEDLVGQSWHEYPRANGEESGDTEPRNPDRPMVVDLSAEIASMSTAASSQRRGYAARTLVKEAGLRVVLMRFKAGAMLPEHVAPGRSSLQTVMGRLRVPVRGEVTDLP